MAARSSSSPPGGGAAVDRAPLLGGDRAEDPGRQFHPPRASLRGAANFIRRATGRRRRMREPSVRVREAAAEQIEERQTGWAYSRPVVLLDVTWNLAFVAVAAAVLATSGGESPSVPLRAWIAGYALLCSVHMACACVEYRRRQSAPGAGSLRGVTNAGGGGAGSVGFSVEVEEVSGYGGSERSEDEERTRHCY